MRIPVFLLLLFIASTATAADLTSRRAAFNHALAVAERGPLSDYASIARPLANHPLAAYLEFAHLLRQLDSVAPARIERYLIRHAELPIATPLRDAWLYALIKRKDWANYLTFYINRPDVKGPAVKGPDLTLRCGSLHARLIHGADPTFLDDAQALWLSGAAVPALCDPSFLALKVAGRLTPTRIWQRIDLAATAGNVELMRFLARSLPQAQKTLAESYAGFLAAPAHAPSTRWPRDERSQRTAVHGLTRLAKTDPDAAEALFAALATPLTLDDTGRGQVLNQIALWSAASYLPNAAARFARVPPKAYDDRLHEWRAREALSRNDLAATRRAIAAMPEAQRADPRWRYIDARLRERGGDRPGAASAFAALAREPSYYGFLAADRLDQPYALCPLEATGAAAARTAVAKIPGLLRAFELHAIHKEAWARREWDAALKSLDSSQRRLAVAQADAIGWYDRAVFTLKAGEDLRLYALRFPLPHARPLRAEAKKHGLDPAWVAALIRAESAWLTDARSHANARGLMQLLPATARDEAKRRGLPWGGDASLFHPLANLALGTAHLQHMLARHGGKPYLATAAYNAGPTPVARWLAQRPPHEPDLWIETIPYHETRDYVARILAFSVIYDWRLDGKAVPVTRRMQGDTGRRVARREFVCPTITPVASTP